jgi:hypothetical protein
MTRDGNGIKIPPAIAGFEDGGRRPGTKESEKLLEAGKGEQKGSFLQPLERKAALSTHQLTINF